MEFDLLDRYLLDGSVKKSEVVADLLRRKADVPGAAAFYQGLELLGAKAPDLSLMALRLVLAGKKADDHAVVHLRHVVERSRAKGIDAGSAREEYFRMLAG